MWYNTYARTAGVWLVVLQEVPIHPVVFRVRVAADRIAQCARILYLGLTHLDIPPIMANHASCERGALHKNNLRQELGEHVLSRLIRTVSAKTLRPFQVKRTEGSPRNSDDVRGA